MRARTISTLTKLAGSGPRVARASACANLSLREQISHARIAWSKAYDDHIMTSTYISIPRIQLLSGATPSGHFSSSGARIENYPKEDDVVFGLLYWDRAAFVRPLVPGIMSPMRQTTILDAFQAAGPYTVIGRDPFAPVFSGNIFVDTYKEVSGLAEVGPQATSHLLNYLGSRTADLIQQANGRSTISRRGGLTIQVPRSNRETPLLAKLNECVPIVQTVSDPEKFLRWRETHSVALRRIRNSAAIVASAIEGSGDMSAGASAVERELVSAVEEAVRTGREQGLRMRLGSMNIVIRRQNVGLRKILEDASLSGFIPALISPAAGTIFAALGAAAANFDMKIDARSVSTDTKIEFPYEVYRDLQHYAKSFA